MAVCVCVCVCVRACVRAHVHARERACVPSYSFKIVWILVCFFVVAYIMTVFITALYIGCDVRWQRRISHFVDLVL